MLSNIIAILFRPATTIERILKKESDLWWIVTISSATAGNVLHKIFRQSPAFIHDQSFPIFLIAGIGYGLAFTLLGTCILHTIGKKFGGKGTYNQLLRATGWGYTPRVLSLIAWIPLFFLAYISDDITNTTVLLNIHWLDLSINFETLHIFIYSLDKFLGYWSVVLLVICTSFALSITKKKLICLSLLTTIILLPFALATIFALYPTIESVIN